MSRRRHCSFPGCSRFARVDGDRCTAHRDAVNPDSAPARSPEAEVFAARIEQGDYRALFGGNVNSLIRQAAEESGLDNELGVLRVVMARLMSDTDADPAATAAAIAKIVGSIVTVTKAQRQIAGAVGESITDAITTILEELSP